eukprot:GDKJ01049678.1.p1 GENE.GDKJ01049678.1~~GDKJ01049678.1.p1  ORF type:complete len:553 (+),score=107.03 GDKJ01049678.1:204-1661(+)
MMNVNFCSDSFQSPNKSRVSRCSKRNIRIAVAHVLISTHSIFSQKVRPVIKKWMLNGSQTSFKYHITEKHYNNLENLIAHIKNSFDLYRICDALMSFAFIKLHPSNASLYNEHTLALFCHQAACLPTVAEYVQHFFESLGNFGYTTTQLKLFSQYKKLKSEKRNTGEEMIFCVDPSSEFIWIWNVLTNGKQTLNSLIDKVKSLENEEHLNSFFSSRGYLSPIQDDSDSIFQTFPIPVDTDGFSSSVLFSYSKVNEDGSISLKKKPKEYHLLDYDEETAETQGDFYSATASREWDAMFNSLSSSIRNPLTTIRTRDDTEDSEESQASVLSPTGTDVKESEFQISRPQKYQEDHQQEPTESGLTPVVEEELSGTENEDFNHGDKYELLVETDHIHFSLQGFISFVLSPQTRSLWIAVVILIILLKFFDIKFAVTQNIQENRRKNIKKREHQQRLRLQRRLDIEAESRKLVFNSKTASDLKDNSEVET